MTGGQKAVIASGSIIVLAIVAGVLATLRPTSVPNTPLTGVVLTQDADPRKQIPIANAEVTVEVDQITVQAKSDSSGFFRLVVPARINAEHPAILRFQQEAYQAFEMTETNPDRICVARMAPIPAKTRAEPGTPKVEIADIRVRYSVKSTTTVDVASIAQTFEIANTGDLPCNPAGPCSPDNRWKAVIGTASFDAGKGNEFRDPRASCIAGPCPFTRLESVRTLNGGRTLTILARDWSDTTTFLVEAEITRTQISDMVRISYPFIPFISGEEMDFTLPATAEGPSIEAEVSGLPIVFPLGPDLDLSWAACTLKIDADHSRLYRCELKPGYRFRPKV